jgi:uncharacterized CHY-type Zn-finger protein
MTRNGITVDDRRRAFFFSFRADNQGVRLAQGDLMSPAYKCKYYFNLHSLSNLTYKNLSLQMHRGQGQYLGPLLRS